MNGRSTLSEESQKQRFEQAARELGVDLDEDRLKETLRRMGPRAAVNEAPGELGLEPPVTDGAPVRDDP